MGRPKDFPVIFNDLVTKYKSKSMADKEYKTYMLLAREQGLAKNAKLSDVNTTDTTDKLDDSTIKRSGGMMQNSQKKKHKGMLHPTPAAGVSVTSTEKVLYERLLEAERLRAEAEKQRGDDLSKIAMMLAGGKGGALDGPAEDVIPQSPAAAAAGVLDDNPEHSKTPSNKDEDEEHTQQGTQNTMTTEQKRETRTKQKHDKNGGSVTKSKSKGNGKGLF